ncbi:MAG: hypothetical protein KC589_02540 [Nanoarchaeota archaeon]|nr:hypothetical protein [Nanoarchaeota archaeon]
MVSTKEKNTFSNLFVKSKDIFVNNFLLILKFSLVFAFVGLISQLIVIIDFENQGINYVNDVVATDFSMDVPLNTWPIMLVNIVLELLLAFLAIILIVNFHFNSIGKNKTIIESFDFTVSRLFYLIFTSILQTILLIFLFILLIVPGLIFSIYWIFVYLAVLFREKSFFNALVYSFNLVRNNWWRTLGYLVILLLIIIAVAMIFFFIFGLIMFFGNLNNTLYLIMTFIQILVVLPFNYFLVIFLIQYFLAIEEEKKDELELMEKAEVSDKKTDFKLNKKTTNKKTKIKAKK